MKIDLHTHTRKCKQGDPTTRNIEPHAFCEKVLATDVKIIAITNHNQFDLAQFNEILRLINGEIQVWPGVELDVEHEGSRGHLLVIACPKRVAEFAVRVAEITQGTTPDNFLTTIAGVLSKFDDLSPIYIAHHGSKKPDLTDSALDELSGGSEKPHLIIKEVSNAISAGIYINHGHSSIHGSDIQNWEFYSQEAIGLPELRLKVDSFEQFCLLLEKDPATINTALRNKTAEKMNLLPFGGEELIYLQVYNDINVIFGAKGTGKTEILRAIAEEYTREGQAVSVFTSGEVKIEAAFDLKCSTLVVDLDRYGIHRCTSEIGKIRNAQEVAVTNLSGYFAHFLGKETNRRSIKIKLKSQALLEEIPAQSAFDEMEGSLEKVEDFGRFVKGSAAVRSELSETEFKDLIALIERLRLGLENRTWVSFVDLQGIKLMNSAIQFLIQEVHRKTGTPGKPPATGFKEYAVNRLRLEAAAQTILANIKKPIVSSTERIGTLGSAKGELDLTTEIRIQDGYITDSTYGAMGGKKNLQKLFSKGIAKIKGLAFSETLFAAIGEFNAIEDIDLIDSLDRLLLCRRYFALNGKPYTPSTGEGSMLMLQKELGNERDIYILDEPEKSLGNEYISDVIVPMIKDRARANKKIFISTHDANVAVRTLPYSSIFRIYDEKGYRTYVGNPFTNYLVNPADPKDVLDWKDISMRTLEGGEAAFGERGRIYGKN